MILISCVLFYASGYQGPLLVELALQTAPALFLQIRFLALSGEGRIDMNEGHKRDFNFVFFSLFASVFWFFKCIFIIVFVWGFCFSLFVL